MCFTSHANFNPSNKHNSSLQREKKLHDLYPSRTSKRESRIEWEILLCTISIDLFSAVSKEI
ncbi:hypothetical protein WN51_02607 [Melipona quadrifasciata]|uniref:Uncharacterized protein n=1 Tax=Melipona quadrifasciata TaxID=166423 RepID=A0A0N0U420_9HYME|nr:hypothetical protein WN51_02607 [Melipona quadrifasciata]